MSNLRWTTQNSNIENRTSAKSIYYQYLDDIPDESIIIDFYNQYEFDDDKYYYWYDEDIFQVKIDDNIYRKLHINIHKSGTRFVCMKSNNNYSFQVVIDRLKQ